MSIQRSLNEMLGSIGQVYYQATAPERFAQEQAEAQKKAEQEKEERFQKEIRKREQATDIELEHAVDLAIKNDEFGPAAEATERMADIAYEKFQRVPSQEAYKFYTNLKQEAQDYREAQNAVAEERRKAEKEALEAQKNAQIGLMEQRQVRKDLLNNLKQVSTKEMVNEIVSRGQMSEKASQRYINREKKGVSK